MLHPVGKLPPAIYWRRRLIFVLIPAFLILILIIYLFSGDGGSTKPTASSTSSGASSTGSASPKSLAASPTSSATSSAATSAASGASAAGTRVCTADDLKVEAATGKPSYVVKSQPDLYLVVTNVSATPCQQDLADSQIVLVITTGDVRIWGSHDCQIQPGIDSVTLTPNVAVRRGIVWLGQTSAPSCPDNRLVAQAGNYNLTATLAGKASAPVAFALTAAS
ncbi:MAG: hypothetical protein JWM76_3664 [Pseudonocardiales bacterium]|nr:hypothetical protein [Pseudonocardiales bacterium]